MLKTKIEHVCLPGQNGSSSHFHEGPICSSLAEVVPSAAVQTLRKPFRAATVLFLATGLSQSGTETDRWRVDGDRLNQRLQELALIGSTSEGGSNRVAFSPEDAEARSFVKNLMEIAGLEIRIDSAANIVGRRPGRAKGIPSLMLGSHIDTVPQGGRFDGTVGVMAAVEAAQTLHDREYLTRHPLEVWVFANEEGGKTGSRLLIGEVMPNELDLATRSGKTIREGIAFAGGDPKRLEEARRRTGEIAAYLELHIEQGAVLDSRRVPIGIVEGIVGIKRWYVSVEGFANHAGTTPMNQRRDALLAAARFINSVHRVVRDTSGRQVGTVGWISAVPGAPNVIPGKVKLSLELRDLDMVKIDQLFEAIQEEGSRIGQETGTSFEYEHFYTSRAALTSARLKKSIERVAEMLKLSTLHLPSGAGHDAQSIAQLAPIGMIFIPSVDGISHSPQEFSKPGDIVAGANVLLQTLLRLDRELDP